MFSVIIPLYNKELSVKNTILSVLDQTYQDFEIIVVNDGSTDKSAEIVADIKDSRIILYNKVNGGVSSARNFGINKAKYKWIAFLDGDDLWKPNHLQIVNEMINQFPHERLFATSFNYSDNRNVKRIQRNNKFTMIDNYFEESLNEVLVWTSVMVINKTCLDNLEIIFREDLYLGEDIELWHRLLNLYKLIKASDVTAIYKLDAENRSNSKKENIHRSILSKLNLSNANKYENKWNKKFIRIKLKQYLKKRHWYNAFYLIRKYNFKIL